MVRRLPVILFGVTLLVSACGGRSGGFSPADGYADMECVPYARDVSGIQLFGEAASWWEQAEGRYARSAEPVAGGVLVFRRSQRLPAGHVAVVSALISNREIRVTQANWVHHHVTAGDKVIDVSPDNDWTAVRVWWPPAGAMGSTQYPTYGFVVPAGGDDRVALR